MNANKLLKPWPGLSVRHGSVAACLLLSAWALPAIGAPNAGDNTAAHAPRKGYSLLHSFSGGDGQNVWSQIVKGKNGYLYGTANGGGSDTNGVVYEIAPDGTESTLYNFAGGNDGAIPASLPRLFADKSGNLYGTTIYGVAAVAAAPAAALSSSWRRPARRQCSIRSIPPLTGPRPLAA
jgi:uncharacterized repeat protein (TIGR03803 family)